VEAIPQILRHIGFAPNKEKFVEQATFLIYTQNIAKWPPPVPLVQSSQAALFYSCQILLADV
jgi:hypothetical protein